MKGLPVPFGGYGVPDGFGDLFVGKSSHHPFDCILCSTIHNIDDHSMPVMRIEDAHPAGVIRPQAHFHRFWKFAFHTSILPYFRGEFICFTDNKDTIIYWFFQ